VISYRELIATPGVESVQLTTNGTRLPELAQPLFDAWPATHHISSTRSMRALPRHHRR